MQRVIDIRQYKVHGTSLDGKNTVEFPSRNSLEEVELDIKRAFDEKGCEGVIIFEAKEIRLKL